MRAMASKLQAGGLGRLANTAMSNKYRLPMVEITPSGKNLQAIASAVIETFNDRRISMFEDADLHRDLHHFRLEERSYGFRLVSPKDQLGHGDMGTAFGLSLLAATQFAAKPIIKVGVVNDDGSVGGDNQTTPYQRALNRFEHNVKVYAEEQEMFSQPEVDDGWIAKLRR